MFGHAKSLLTASVVARVPNAMMSIALLVHAQHLTGSFQIAGLVSAAYAVALGAGGPALGRAADRVGQTRVLRAAAPAQAALLAAVAIAPATPALLVVLAAGIGLTTPPVGACLRTLLPQLVAGHDLQRAFTAEATIVELTWVAGPPVALLTGAVLGTAAALATAGAIGLAATLVFARHPASRRWTPTPRHETGGAGPLRTPAVRRLVGVMAGAGVVFGVTEVAITAQVGNAGAAGYLGLWGIGSLAGGALATRKGTPGITTCLTALGVTHAALIVSPALIVLAGATIAPTFAVVYAHTDRHAPKHAVTEAFAWLATASATGSAAGAALAGALVETQGTTPAYAAAGLAGAAAAAVAGAGGRAKAAPATA